MSTKCSFFHACPFEVAHKERSYNCNHVEDAESCCGKNRELKSLQAEQTHKSFISSVFRMLTFGK